MLGFHFSHYVFGTLSVKPSLLTFPPRIDQVLLNCLDVCKHDLNMWLKSQVVAVLFQLVYVEYKCLPYVFLWLCKNCLLKWTKILMSSMIPQHQNLSLRSSWNSIIHWFNFLIVGFHFSYIILIPFKIDRVHLAKTEQNWCNFLLTGCCLFKTDCAIHWHWFGSWYCWTFLYMLPWSYIC